MRALAPGKVVLSGAYAVLEGAPAIVAAVDRYVVADSSRPGQFLTDEVKAAGFSAPYWFDASELRQGDRKLGLGSSAAILVSTIAARALERSGHQNQEALANDVYPVALAAHRQAQGGGSGIDVAASCYGGVLLFQRVPSHACADALPQHTLADATIRPLTMPLALQFEVWCSSVASSTASMLRHLRDFASQHPAAYGKLIAAQGDAATATASAWEQGDLDALLLGFRAQRAALQQLGAAAGIPIVTAEVAALADVAEARGSALLPAGAGGGDIALYVGRASSDFMTDAIHHRNHQRLTVTLAAPGVHADKRILDSEGETAP